MAKTLDKHVLIVVSLLHQTNIIKTQKQKIMKATVSHLWNTGREIISFDGSEIERPTAISQLKKCENVLVGDKLFNGGPTEVMIDDKIYLVVPVKLQHPSGCGTMYALEIL